MKVNTIRTQTTPYNNINHSNRPMFKQNENAGFVQSTDSTTFKRTDSRVKSDIFHKIGQFLKTPTDLKNDPRYSESPYIRSFLF